MLVWREMAELENKFHFTEATTFDAEYRKLTAKTAELQSIVSAFIRNIARVTQLGAIPVKFVATATLRMSMELAAKAALGVPITGETNEEKYAVAEKGQSLMEEFCRRPDFSKSMIAMGITNVELLVASSIKWMTEWQQSWKAW